jgi:hypothetical protein
VFVIIWNHFLNHSMWKWHNHNKIFLQGGSWDYILPWKLFTGCKSFGKCWSTVMTKNESFSHLKPFQPKQCQQWLDCENNAPLDSSYMPYICIVKAKRTASNNMKCMWRHANHYAATSSTLKHDSVRYSIITSLRFHFKLSCCGQKSLIFVRILNFNDVATEMEECT